MSTSDDAKSAPAWPSLERQLAESRVVHGSALEKLIHENQDFSILYPREANDGLGIPPWLRVYYRKQHPELEYPEASPSVGYPMALRDYYEWIVEHQDLAQPGKP